jgi:endonuclease/exonuclease/phosphatase family metal-dependent hydrolase
MTPGRWLARTARSLVISATLILTTAPAAHALRVVNYNILNYPSLSGAARDPHFRTILAPLAADIVVVQEIQSQDGVNQFLTSVLNTNEPGQWAAAPFFNGPDTDNALFYRTSAVTLLGTWAWLPPDNLRYVAVYRLRPAGYLAETTELRIYSQHLKASSGSTNEARRLTDAISIRDSMNAVPPGSHAILTGDFNIYRGAEPAFLKFKEVQADNDGRIYDPLNFPLTTWNTAGLAPDHTQSPCNSGCPGGFATGGVDDRFDMFLPTFNLNDGQGMELLLATYKPVGNDGLHYNLNINALPVIPEGQAYADALFGASDHLPIRVDIQLFARLAAAGALDLGTVIAGGSANLGVTNAAAAPADVLDYSFTAPAGFTAPGGGFQLASGAPAAQHAIATTPGGFGPRAGSLTIASDDPDQPAKLVALTATVLDHATPSLDSLSIMLVGMLDLGQHEAGTFAPEIARVHNHGYAATKAQLRVTGGTIVGGDGRFSIAGGFAPAQVSAVSAPYTIVFDDAGATADSVYEATLTFATADEALPGATLLASPVYTLRAELTGGTVAVEDRPLPAADLLYAPFPNPLQGLSATVRFDLARRTEIRLDVFDLNGRRVATLAEGAFVPGRYAFQWNGRGARGDALGSGLYFVRLSGAGLAAQMRRVALVR